MITGCGSVKDPGSAIDAPIDMAGPDADTSGNASVSTKGALFQQVFTTAIADVDLISSLPSREILTTGKSDGTGAATIRVFPGGSLTAAYKHTVDMGFDFITFVGVKPGDTLEFGNRKPDFSGPQTNLGSMTYSWPLQAGVQSYQVHTGCVSNGVGPTTTSLVGAEFTSCHREPMDIVYMGVDNMGRISHCNSRQNQAFVNGATINIGGWGTASSATANITGIPLEYTRVATRFSTVVDAEREVFVPGAQQNGTLTGGAFTGNFQYCGSGERTYATLSLTKPAFYDTRVHDFLPASATSWTVASPVLPPGVEFDFLVSAVNRRAAWGISPTTAPSDAVIVRLVWSVDISGMTHRSSWYFILPPNTQEVTMPKLPASFEPFLPQPEFGLALNFVRTVEIPTITSYDAFRMQGAATAICADCVVRAGDLPRVIISGI